MKSSGSIPGISLNLLAIVTGIGLVFGWGYMTNKIVTSAQAKPTISKHYTIVDNPNCNVGKMK